MVEGLLLNDHVNSAESFPWQHYSTQRPSKILFVRRHTTANIANRRKHLQTGTFKHAFSAIFSSFLYKNKVCDGRMTGRLLPDGVSTAAAIYN